MTIAGVIPIYNLDKEVKVFLESNAPTEVGMYFLRGAFYTVKMSDGHTLLTELHQVKAMAHVDVVIGKTKEAREMVVMLKKNVAA